ncbi:MAG: thiamine phosphate synthase [Anaerotignum sp.]
MIICMYDILCVTNRSLCKEDFLQRVEKIAACRPKGIILREKDLTEEEYKKLAEQVLKLCERYEVPCMLHSFADAAIKLGAENIHLPLHILRELDEKKKEKFKEIGASCHSVEEAQEAEKLGCTYITAGHVFATDCKKGLPPRGLTFLQAVCQSVSIPVYAIGGIGSENIDSVRKAGAKGACIMSGLMGCEDVERFLKALK